MFSKILKYQVCLRCIMDTSADEIIFDNNGICNYCSDFLLREKKFKKEKKDLTELLEKIKSEGKKKNMIVLLECQAGLIVHILLCLQLKMA